MTESGLRVVADVGGTNTRIAIYDRAADVFVENLRRYLAGQPLLNQVDLEKGY